MSLKWLWVFFWLIGPTNQSRPIADLVNFYVFCTIWIEFSMWTANPSALLLLLPCYCIAPGLLLACSQPAPGLPIVCSCPAPGPAHPSLAAFIIINFFSARREPPFMVMIWSCTQIPSYSGLLFMTEPSQSNLCPSPIIASIETQRWRWMLKHKTRFFFLLKTKVIVEKNRFLIHAGETAKKIGPLM